MQALTDWQAQCQYTATGCFIGDMLSYMTHMWRATPMLNSDVNKRIFLISKLQFQQAKQQNQIRKGEVNL